MHIFRSVCMYVCMYAYHPSDYSMSHLLQGEQLLEAAKNGDTLTIESLLKNNFVVNYKDLVRSNSTKYIHTYIYVDIHHQI